MYGKGGVGMTYHVSGSTWFLAQMKPNCVSIAERNLTRQGFRTFLPTEEVTRERQGKFVTAHRPLFPGYIFLSFDIKEGHWRKVNSTFGISRLVSFDREPAVVPLDLVSQLMLRCDATGRLLPPRLLKPGDQVMLTTGPFASFVGEVEKIAPDRRVWVLLEIMGGQTRVAVNARGLRATLG
jgi:transcriptional antiterminator RfaH